MPIFKDGRKIREVFYQGRRVKEVWWKGRKIYARYTGRSVTVHTGGNGWLTDWGTGNPLIASNDGRSIRFSVPVATNRKTWAWGRNIPAYDRLRPGDEILANGDGEYTFWEVSS